MQVMVEKCSRVKPGVLGISEHSTNPYEILGDIMQLYINHPINI